MPIPRLAIGCLTALALSAPGCGGAGERPLTAADRALIGTGAVCQALDGISDLRMALANDPEFATGAPFGANIAHRDRLGETQAAAARIVRADPGSRLAVEVAAYQRELGDYADRLDAAADTVHGTFAEANATLEEALTCRGIHVLAHRKVSKTRPLSVAERSGAASAEETAEAKATARSAACAPQARLGSILAGMSLGSPVTIRRLSSHASETALGPADRALRESTLPILGAHADALDAYLALVDDRPTQTDAARGTLEKLQTDLSESLESTQRACLRRQVVEEPEGATTTDARSVVVTVRPKWSGKLDELSPGASGSSGFGSGFLVRARAASGELETFVVTNRHVIDGALEADIIPATADSSTAESSKRAALGASLLFVDPNDDIAILRLDDKARQRLAPISVRLRATPVAEQEGVVAAGFPAVGNRPSFQVTTGVISNAHFDGTDDDVGVTFIQHTAPVDPGNSGGPLLDGQGRVVGINTAKVNGRENTNLAIPTTRILASLARLSRPRAYNANHAQAACDAALAALASPAPAIELTSRFARRLFERTDAIAPSDQPAGESTDASSSAQVVGAPSNPLEAARLRGYELVRRRVDAAGGVAPFTRCQPKGGDQGTYAMSFQTQGGAERTVTLVPEDGELRVGSLR